jgi:hypothetical protein
VILAKENYERHKKLREEKDKVYQLKLEADELQYNPNELQIAVFRRELEKVNKEQAAIEHEKLRNPRSRKQINDMLRDLAEDRANQAKQLTAP